MFNSIEAAGKIGIVDQFDRGSAHIQHVGLVPCASTNDADKSISDMLKRNPNLSLGNVFTKPDGGKRYCIENNTGRGQIHEYDPKSKSICVTKNVAGCKPFIGM